MVSEARRKATAKYQKEKCKQRIIMFYPKDQDIYEYSKTINFQAFIKAKLRELKEGGDNGTIQDS